MTQSPELGPVILAYDGSELGGQAITAAAAQLTPGREAIVVCVWQPADVGFSPVTAQPFDADQATAVRAAAEETAAHGVRLAEAAGFRARGVTVEHAPTWKGIVQVADEENASLIVIGSHRHGGLIGHLVGNIASAVVTHATLNVLVVHPRA